MAYVMDETFDQACVNFEILHNSRARPWDDKFRAEFFACLGMQPDERGDYDYKYMPLPYPHRQRWWFPDDAAVKMGRLASPYFRALMKAAEINDAN